MSLRSFDNIHPQVSNSAYIDETALVIGQVRIGSDSSIWPYSVARGDVNTIKIGEQSNVQDHCVLHVTHKYNALPDGFPLVIGARVTVGHRSVLHGCHIGDACLIGMGSIIMDGAVVHNNVLIGAGSLVPPGKVLESGFLWLGNPVKRSRPLSEKEIEWIDYSSAHYVKLKENHRLSIG